MSNLTEAQNLIQSEKLNEARELIVDILYADYDNIDAWLLLTQCALDDEEYTRAVREALRIDPENLQARRLAVDLARDSSPRSAELGNTLEARQRRSSAYAMRSITNVLIACLVIGGGAIFAFLLLSNQNDKETSSVLPIADALQACYTEINSVLSRLPSRCGFVENGQVCLANTAVDFELISGENLPIEFVGDRALLENFKSFNTTPFQSLSWGILALRAPTSFPPSSGDSVLFIVTSGVRLSGFDATMSQFTFSSNPVVSPCPSVPPSGILISAPLDKIATFTANGATLNVSGAAFLQVDVAAGLKIIVLQGSVSIAEDDAEVDLSAGEWLAWNVDPTLHVQGNPQAIQRSSNSIRGDLSQLKPLSQALNLSPQQWQIPGEIAVVSLPSPTRLTPTESIEVIETDSPVSTQQIVTATRRSPSFTPSVTGTPPTATASLTPRPSSTPTSTYTATPMPTRTPSATNVPPTPTSLPIISPDGLDMPNLTGEWLCSATVDTLLFDYILTIETIQSPEFIVASAELPAFGHSIVALSGRWTTDANQLDNYWLRIPDRGLGDVLGWLFLQETALIYDASTGTYKANGILRLTWFDTLEVSGGLFIKDADGQETLVGLINNCQAITT